MLSSKFCEREGDVHWYEVEKVGGKDEINSQVYGTLKVAGISLTTWQPATVLASAGELNSIDGSARQTGPGYHSFSLDRATDSVNDSAAKLLRNFASTMCNRTQKKPVDQSQGRYVSDRHLRQTIA